MVSSIPNYYWVQHVSQGGDNIIVVDNTLNKVEIWGEQFERLKYMGLSISGAAVAEFGLYGELSLGYIPNDATFL